MRLARLLCADVAQPVLALERDGALYDVGELDRIFDTRFSPERTPGAADIHTRVIALGGAGLDDLDARLLAGDRPTEARVLPGSFVWLAPCDTDRAAYVQLAPPAIAGAETLHRLGDARSILGNATVVPFPPSAGRAVAELSIAAVLREPLVGATPGEAERAIAGYAILNAWSGGAPAQRAGWVSWRVPAQIGPVLVTAEEVPERAPLRAQVRVDGAVVAAVDMGASRASLAQSIATLSRWGELRAGDVIGAGTIRDGRHEVPFGAHVELVVERLGKLEGRPILAGD